MTWLCQRGFAAPQPVVAFERRRAGFVQVAVLATERWPGTDLAALLPTLAEEERRPLVVALIATIDAWHDAGFRDGNLDLRNVLARRVAGNWEFAKIDSPKFRIVAQGNHDDRWRRADWKRLTPQLAALGLAVAARSGGSR